MKSANEYGQAELAAQIALCGDEPSSHSAGAIGPARQRQREPRERVSLGKLASRYAISSASCSGKSSARLHAPVALQRERGLRIRARRTPDAEIDAIAVEPRRAR